MKAIGITSGIGSLLIGARNAGFDIVGNIEWRKYYHTDTFVNNFPGAVMVVKLEHLKERQEKLFMNADLAMGHPECGNFSNLRVNKTAMLKDPSDIPLFAKMVKRFKPRFFVQDNLPKSLLGFTIENWAEILPEYDLFPEWISNYHYGNSQINRKRFFMIGALKKEKFIFRPGEFEHLTYLGDVVEGLPPKKNIKNTNHMHWKDTDEIKGWMAYNFPELKKEGRITVGDFKGIISEYPSRKNFQYINLSGELKLRPGYSKIILNNFSPVMTGGGGAPDNHYRADTLNALTIRERARIQGCPDDFIFYPLDYMDNPSTYMKVYKQTGKFMPVEFAEYISQQIMSHIQKREFKSSGKRILKPNNLITEAKEWYCQKVGYRKRPCEECWVSCKRRLRDKLP